MGTTALALCLRDLSNPYPRARNRSRRSLAMAFQFRFLDLHTVHDQESGLGHFLALGCFRLDYWGWMLVVLEGNEGFEFGADYAYVGFDEAF